MASRERSSVAPANVDWSKIPSDVLCKIFSLLRSLPDCLRFSYTCHSWRFVATSRLYRLTAPRFPFIMAGVHRSSRIPATTVSAFSLVEDEEFKIPLPAGVPWCRFIGSSDGWLAALDPYGDPFLFNPISGDQISLPPISSMPGILIVSAKDDEEPLSPLIEEDLSYQSDEDAKETELFVKIVLPQLFDSSSYVAVAILHGDRQPAFATAGCGAWTAIETSIGGEFVDAAFHDGLLFLVNNKGVTVACDPRGPSPSAIACVIEPATSPRRAFHSKYLVESSGELLLVWEVIGSTAPFEVYKLDCGRRIWKKVDTLGGCAFLIGTESSISIPAEQVKVVRGTGLRHRNLRANHIYNGFQGICYEAFDVETGALEDFKPRALRYRGQEPPLWFTPLPPAR